MITAAELRKQYTNPLSSEDIRVILKISKRKASWLLQNGYIKCYDSGKQTRRYSVMIDDLIEYIEKVESGELIVNIPAREFNNKEAQTHRDSTAFPKNLPADFKEWLIKEWKNLDDALSRKQVMDITGYSEKTLTRWLREGKLVSIPVQNRVVIPKSYLIDFMCGEVYNSKQKSPQHIELLKKYYKM